MEAVNIRDFTRDKHKKVDDYPYGGGAGMVMQAEPIYLAYQHIEQKMEKKPRVIYVTPQGKVFHQELSLIHICARIQETIISRKVESYTMPFSISVRFSAIFSLGPKISDL